MALSLLRDWECGGIWPLQLINFDLQGNSLQPDCLVLNHLPFAEDLRVAKFASLDEKPDLMPSLSQLDQMRTVVQDLDLSTGLS